MKTFALLALTMGCFGVGATLTAPSAQAQQAKIKSVVMSRGYNGEAVGVTRTFKTTNLKVHCVVKLDRVETLTARGVWFAVDAGGMHNFKIVAAQLPRQRVDTLHFFSSLPRPWPVGKYRVDIYLNGKFTRSVPYTMVK